MKKFELVVLCLFCLCFASCKNIKSTEIISGEAVCTDVRFDDDYGNNAWYFASTEFGQIYYYRSRTWTAKFVIGQTYKFVATKYNYTDGTFCLDNIEIYKENE